MELSRRTFISSSLAAGLVAAANATQSRWLLSSQDALRVGFVNSGSPSHIEHLLFSAIPGAQIAAVFGTDRRAIHDSLAHLQELNKPAPAVYSSLDQMLAARSVDAIYLADHGASSSSLLLKISEAGYSVMTGLPCEMAYEEAERHLQHLSHSASHIMFGMNHIAGSASISDPRQWLLRDHARNVEATLSLPIMVDAQQMRSAGIISLTCLLGVCGKPRRGWMDNQISVKAESRRRRDLFGTIPLPANPYGMGQLRIQAIGGDKSSSVLRLSHAGGEFHLPISRDISPQASLQEVMQFLSKVRYRKPVDHTESKRARIASQLLAHNLL